jgi:hypothetical protein
MKCQKCSTQWDGAELNCPFCRQIAEDAEKKVPLKIESGSEVRCLYCTSMVSTGEKFCNSCRREQTFKRQAKVSSSTGDAIGLTCGGCAVVLVVAILTILAVGTAFFKSLVGA